MATTSHAVITSDEQLAQDAILWIPRDSIDPDPEQVRSVFTGIDELRESIKAEGLKEVLRVRPHPADPDRFMLVSGERRWRATEGLERVRDGAPDGCLPCVLSLDEEGLEPADRLISQYVSNTGAPLTPMEEARLFKTLEDAGVSQVEIARRLGVPRSSVGDRIRLLDVHPAWLKLYDVGKLTVSHLVALAPYAPVPAEEQVKAAERFTKDYRFSNKKDEPMMLKHFKDLVREVFAPALHPLTPRPSGKGYFNESNYCKFNPADYTGVVISVPGRHAYDSRPQRHAADPKVWGPLKRAADKDRRNSRPPDAVANRSMGRPANTPPKLPTGVKVESRGTYLQSYEAEKLGVVVYDASAKAWHFGDRWNRGGLKLFDVDVFLAAVDHSKVRCLMSTYSGGYIVTSDTAAHGKARSSYLARQRAQLVSIETALRETIAREGEARYEAGFGAQIPDPFALGALRRLVARGESLSLLQELAALVGVELPELKGKAEVAVKAIGAEAATTLVAAIGIMQDLGLDYPSETLATWEQAEAKRLAKRPLAWRKKDAAPADVEVPVRVSDDAVQEITASRERDEQQAGDGDDLWDAATPAEHEAICIGCGCTDNEACESGCSWLTVTRGLSRGKNYGVCTSCAKDADEAKLMAHRYVLGLDIHTGAGTPHARRLGVKPDVGVVDLQEAHA